VVDIVVQDQNTPVAGLVGSVLDQIGIVVVAGIVQKSILAVLEVDTAVGLIGFVLDFLEGFVWK
jgi:hypothetical protein